jgi:hypothetical protein
MASGPDFIWSYLPFWVVNYGLALVIWTCIGRFLLAWFVPAIQPSNYIWRAFVALTEWAVRAASWITPRYVRPAFLPPIAAFWLYQLRLVFFFAMWSAGMTPSLSSSSG